MLRRSDGSVMSANTPTAYNKPVWGKEDYKLYRVLLTKAFYTDDEKNVTKGSPSPEMTYEGIIIGGKTEGQTVANIRDAAFLSGGKTNVSERVYRACTKPLTGPSAVPISQQDGDVVYVVFIQGDYSFPLIVGTATGILDAGKTGAKKADGPRYKWEYNGIFFEVNKLGELTLTRKGGSFKALEGFFEPDQAGKKLTLKISESRVLLGLNDNALVQDLDGVAEKITITFKSGMTVTIDGKNDMVKILSKGGAFATVDGKTGTIELKDNGSGKLKITGSKVALGASSAELLAEIVAFLDKVITLAGTESSHMHLGNLGFPTGPTTAAGAWSTLASDLGAIKAKIEGIKGTL